MNIIISHAYSKENKGDAALLSVLLTDIQRAFPNARVTVLTLAEIQEGETFEGVPLKRAFMYYARDRYHNKIAQALYACYLGIYTLIWAAVYGTTRIQLPLPKHLQEVTRLYLDADLIIPVGGGYILSKPGFVETVRLFFVLHPLVFAHLIGKVTVNYAQSIGQFGTAFQRWMARFALQRVHGTIVREKISLEVLKKMGITNNVMLSVDSGFLFEETTKTQVREQLHISRDQKVVGITVRSWLAPEKQEIYEKAVAACADHIVTQHDAFVLLIPQVTHDNHKDDDRESSRRVYNYMQHASRAHLMTERFDHQTIKAIYGELDYLIGTRFHSVIFGLTSHVPAIAIGYEHKTRGIMRDLGLEQWVIDIAAVRSDNLIPLFDSLVREREAYVQHVEHVLPPYIDKARTSIFFVKKIYEEHLAAHQNARQHHKSTLE